MIKEEIVELLGLAASEAGYSGVEITNTLTRGKFGDYSTNLAFKLAETSKQPSEPKDSKQPLEIAKKIVLKVKNGEVLEKVEVANSGFINFYVNPKRLLKEVQ